ncbi:hypothetical protein JCM5296_004805, partial [Sporobolomyces johnsonii]
MTDTGTSVSPSKLSFVPTGPSEDIYDFEAGRFLEQPLRNLQDLGFTDRAMTSDMVEHIELEPHNPLLDDEDDDPAVDDLSDDEARQALDLLLRRYDDIFVDELPGPPPFRPVNHPIKLKDVEKKVRPFAIRIP